MIVVASIWHFSPAAWSALAAWVGLGIASAAGVVALRQLREARRLRSEQTQPYVVVYTDESPAGPTNIDLVIKNFGSTAATGVRVTFSAPLESAVLEEYSPIQTPEVIPVLVPGQEWRTFWDTTQARHASPGLPLTYTAKVTFKDSRGKQTFEFRFELDWRALIHRGFVTVYTQHDAARALREISKVLNDAKSASRAINVVTRDGDAIDARERQAFQNRQREEADQPIDEANR